MKSRINKLFNLPSIWFVICIVLLFSLKIIVLFIIYHFIDKETIKESLQYLKGPTYFVRIIKTVLLAPLYETFIFQLGLTKLLIHYDFFKKNPSIIILLSSSLFALAHDIGLIGHFLAGIIFCLPFIIRKNKKYVFWEVVLIHALSNLIGVEFYMHVFR